MKHVYAFTILVLFAPGFAASQTSAGAEKEIRELETRRFHAMQEVDVATLNEILSDDLTYTHSNGWQQTKAEVIGVLGSGELKYLSITTRDLKVRVYGESAVVTGHAMVRIKARGEEETLNICYLDVYVKQEGRWQMVAWQSARVAKQ
jgi:ketosteroid isomerase-like protein